MSSSSSCVSHPHHHLLRHGGGGGARLLRAPQARARVGVGPAAAAASVARRRVARGAMSAEAPSGVALAAAPGPGGAVLREMVEDAAVWCAAHGLVVGDRSDPRSGTVPGVGLVHAPISLLPAHFPKPFWRQACELAPIFNDLVDRVSLDGEFLQDSLSRTRQVDDFTAKLLEIHAKMMAANKKEDIRLGLHRSDYMLDSETNSLLQIELNTISSSFPGLGSLVTELHRTLLNRYGKVLCLDPDRVPRNWASSQFVNTLARAWAEHKNDSAVVMMVVQPEERNMYDQYWLVTHLKESYGVTTIRKTLAQVEAEGKVLTDGTLVVDGRTVAVVYFRAGYTPNDYPSEAEWRARLLMEQSSAVKCPSISYHLVGTKKIQQELAKPNVLERFLDNKEDIAKLRKSFAGLWSLENEEIVESAIEKPDLFVLKPQREGGGMHSYHLNHPFGNKQGFLYFHSGNNIYGHDLRDTLIKLQKEKGESLAAYILMQRIFPKASLTPLARGGVCFEDLTISELGIYASYLRNKDKVLVNSPSGYLMRTKVSSSNEGGVAAGFAVLDSVYLTDE